MVEVNELKIGDGIKYSYQDAENDEYAESYGTVSEIKDGCAYVYIDAFGEDIEIDDYNSYFCDLVEEPTDEEHEEIKKIMDIYWERVNDEEEDWGDLCVGDLIDELYDKETAETLTEKWATFYGFEPIF